MNLISRGKIIYRVCVCEALVIYTYHLLYEIRVNEHIIIVL